MNAVRNGAAMARIESRRGRQRPSWACSSYVGRCDHPVGPRAPPVRAQGVRLRPQADRKSGPLRERRMPRFLAEFARGPLKHLLESFSPTGLPLPIAAHYSRTPVASASAANFKPAINCGVLRTNMLESVGVLRRHATRVRLAMTDWRVADQSRILRQR